MQNKTRFRSRCAIKAARWASYAIAGAATAITANNDAEAAILYSGPLPNTLVGNGAGAVFLKTLVANSHQGTVKLGSFRHLGGRSYASARLLLNNKNGQVVGFVGRYDYASKLATGANVAAGHFNPIGAINYMAYTATHHASSFPEAKFQAAGIGFLGFEFNQGAGEQYGWVRVNMTSGAPLNAFKVVDYAYGTVGQAITVGEEAAPVPEPASLGLLAIGAIGLLAVRRGGKRKISSAAD